jgi:AI-2 transport protein TqsA
MVQEHKEQNWLITVSLVIVAVVAMAVALIYTRAIMVPFVVALFIVALVSPIADFQVKRLRLPRFIAVMITLLVVISIIAMVFLLITQATTTIVVTAWEYSVRFEHMVYRILRPIESIYEYLYREEGEEEPPPIPAPNDTSPVPSAPSAPPVLPPVPLEPVPFELYPVVEGTSGRAILDVRAQTDPPAREPDVARDPNDITLSEPLPRGPIRPDTRAIVRGLRNYIFNIVTNAFGTALGLISGVFFVSIFVIFLLAGRNPYAEHSQVYRDIVQKIRRYVGTKVIVSAVTGVLVWVSLTLLGLPLAEVFGVLAFLLNFIPSIGSIISTLLPIPIALAEFHQDPLRIAMVVAIPGAIQGILGNIIEPKLMGEGLNLHPVAILLALSFWGLLWGIVGMFLAAPITAAIRIVLMQFDTLRPIANLLAGELTTTQPSTPPAGTLSGDFPPE